MSTGVDAIYENGVFRPEQPVSLREKTRVHLVIENASPAADDDDPTGWKTADSFVGFITDAPEGEPIAREHDKHLYSSGLPQLRGDGQARHHRGPRRGR